jgi:hypothetical protein
VLLNPVLADGTRIKLLATTRPGTESPVRDHGAGRRGAEDQDGHTLILWYEWN